MRTKMYGLYIYSVYLAPSMPMDCYERTLDRLVADARSKSPCLKAGDFNAWTTDWGYPSTYSRGQAVIDAMSTLDVVLLNYGDRHTFSRGNAGSIIDLTFASSSLAPNTTWTLCDDYTHSDHLAIVIEVRTRANQMAIPRTRRYKVDTLNIDAFQSVPDDFNGRGNATARTDQLMTQILRACDASMRKTGTGAKRRPVHWWNDDIARARADCFRTRRAYQRALRRSDPRAESLMEQLKGKRQVVKRSIKCSKRRSFLEMCDKADADPCGLAYKLTMKRLHAFRAPTPTCPTLMREIVRHLFPDRLVPGRTQHTIMEDQFTEVTTDELVSSVRRIKAGKAPGPNGIPTAIIRIAMERQPGHFADAFKS